MHEDPKPQLPRAPVVKIDVGTGRIFIDSRAVATYFDRQHYNILQSYRTMHCSSEFKELNFQEFKIKDLTGENLSHLEMTKLGFMALTRPFTGEKAGIMWEKIILQFDAMEAELARMRAAPVELPLLCVLVSWQAERYAAGETMAALAADYEVGEATIFRALQGPFEQVA
jgi:Rha family phage regulatory protein